MQEYAVLDGGQIVRRKSYDLSAWPEYKRDAIDAKGDGGPVYRPVSYLGEGPIEAVAIGMSAVTITRSAAPPAPPPLVDPITAVNIERDRRIAAGCEFGGHVFQTDDKSLRRISDAAKEALGAIVNGAQANDFRWHGGSTDFTFTAADNTEVSMDAPTMWAFGIAVGQRERFLIAKARALKDRDGGPPSDYADDSHWT